jgi:hypothetical protein
MDKLLSRPFSVPILNYAHENDELSPNFLVSL